ncbi:MAG TPA: zinc ABC transporter substrate-binding protein [Thermoanaerobaculia bacterium]|nr:zinc ABC transporter substrate-binding protein [Thermoanaerobaculia bacterium]
MKVSRALFLLLLTGCAAPEKAGDRIRVAVSVAAQGEIVQRIGGDRVAVDSLVAPGASDEDLSLSPRKAMALEHTDLYVKVGHPAFAIEGRYIDPFLARHPEIRVVDMSHGMDLILDDHGHEGGDPHVWVAPQTVAIAARNISAALSEIDPPHASEYHSNLERFLKDIDRLDREIRARLNGGRRAFLVYHPSWGYFARQYGLEQIAIEAEGKEPGAARLIGVIEEARREGAEVVLVPYPRKSAQVLAEAIGGRTVTADPQSADWEETLLRVAGALGGAQGGKS